MLELFIVICLADILWGELPAKLHPVVIVGRLIRMLEKMCRRIPMAPIGQGYLLVFSTLAIVLLFNFFMFQALGQMHPALVYVWAFYIISGCFALRSMIDHIWPIISFTRRQKWSAARAALQKIVGRDVQLLDKRGIFRASTETIAEGFVDGFWAPWFYGVAGYTIAIITQHEPLVVVASAMLAYRAINTMDSMVGYKNSQYKELGFAGAKTDDGANFLPARTALIPLVLAGLGLRLSVNWGLRAFWRDRLKHPSPNAGHSESFFAGSLNIVLGGPTRYAFGLTHKPQLWPEGQPASLYHVSQALQLYVAAAGLILAFVGLGLYWHQS